MTYIFTRHSENPKPQVITRKSAEWMAVRSLGVVYGERQLKKLANGEIDHFNVTDGKLTIEK